VRRQAWMGHSEAVGRVGLDCRSARPAIWLCCLSVLFAPLRARQELETVELEARNARMNERSTARPREVRRTAKAGLKDLEERQQARGASATDRRTESGAGGFGRRLPRSPLIRGSRRSGSHRGGFVSSQELAVNLAYNPNEILQIQALLFGR